MAIVKNKKSEGSCGKKIKCKYLTIEGTRYRTTLNNKFQNRRKWEAPDPSKILSYIPGTIQEVYVKEGDNVNEGDPLVTLEAMKMRNVITSTSRGRIVKLNVTEGEKVPKGHLLVQLKF